jgi:tellurite resistance protein
MAANVVDAKILGRQQSQDKQTMLILAQSNWRVSGFTGEVSTFLKQLVKRLQRFSRLAIS